MWRDRSERFRQRFAFSSSSSCPPNADAYGSGRGESGSSSSGPCAHGSFVETGADEPPVWAASWRRLYSISSVTKPTGTANPRKHRVPTSHIGIPWPCTRFGFPAFSAFAFFGLLVAVALLEGAIGLVVVGLLAGAAGRGAPPTSSSCRLSVSSTLARALASGTFITRSRAAVVAILVGLHDTMSKLSYYPPAA
eukprot:CAMPEP_0119073976 /NCGR_PEP_ID=MMETSP1178-20130426/70482_2 /TAXON_ID=33656 /ORGANISM="unid sp, Strain CCMP2000" /LENGTH=193 /DNA_ID=CAMNT_0007056101 /DNA_START=88 /DNA_END=666 /DNA_ORIENTATION=-